MGCVNGELALVQHSTRLYLANIIRRLECGVGDVPSLPRVAEGVAQDSYHHHIATTDLLKAQVADCFSKVRDLLIIFLKLMEKIFVLSLSTSILQYFVGPQF